MQRRSLIQAAGAAAATLGVPRVFAQEWPNGPVRIVVGFPPGGGTDALARVVGAEAVGDVEPAVIVENKGGVAGVLAAEYVAHAAERRQHAADGAHQQPRARAQPAAQAALQRGARLRADRAGGRHAQPADREPGAEGGDGEGHRRAVHGGARQGELRLGRRRLGAAPGAGDVQAAGQGRCAARALQGQRAAADRPDGRPDPVQLRDDDRRHAAREERQGDRRSRRRALKRAKGHPSVPTMQEQGFDGFEATTWYGLAGPGKLPTPIADKINRDVNTVLAMPDVQERLDTYGAEDGGGSREKFEKFIAAEIAKWGRGGAGCEGEGGRLSARRSLQSSRPAASLAWVTSSQWLALARAWLAHHR